MLSSLAGGRSKTFERLPTYYLANVPRKLHENDENWTGATRWKFYYVDLPLPLTCNKVLTLCSQLFFKFTGFTKATFQQRWFQEGGAANTNCGRHLFIIWIHWRIQGGAPGTRAPPGGPNSFIFMQFSAKIWKIIAILGVGTPPGENPGSAIWNFPENCMKMKKIGLMEGGGGRIQNFTMWIHHWTMRSKENWIPVVEIEKKAGREVEGAWEAARTQFTIKKVKPNLEVLKLM